MAEWQLILADDVQPGNVVTCTETDRDVQVTTIAPGPRYGGEEILFYNNEGPPAIGVTGYGIWVFR